MVRQTRNILVGEGSAEPTSGFAYARALFPSEKVRFYFGVRRCPDGLDVLESRDIEVVANFPGRGMAGLQEKLIPCPYSSHQVTRAIDTGRLIPDAVLVVASPPDEHGVRSLGTANGPLQSAIDKAPMVIVEECPDLPLIKGAAIIPTGKVTHVVPHKSAPFVSLSRPPAELDIVCAKHIASLLADDIYVQLGVGGIVEALADALSGRTGLKIVSGAVGATIRTLQERGCLDPDAPIYGSALVGDDDLVAWAQKTPTVTLQSSRILHNPAWLAGLPKFYSVNIGLSVDLQGNVNAERIKGRHVSGKGGSPNFACGAYHSKGGHAIVALRTDRGDCLENKILRPTIPGRHISFIVTERGIADLRGKEGIHRANTIQNLFCS